MKRQELLDIIYKSVDEINDQFSLTINKDEKARLIGEIDSFVIVNLFAAIEGKLSEAGKNVTIANDKAMGYNSPFKNIDSLADFIMDLW